MIKKIFSIGLLLAVMIGLFSGCAKESEGDKTGDVYPDSRLTLACKSDKTVFDSNDVTLKFYVGSNRAGDYDEGWQNYPAVVYIYFANEDTMVPVYDYNGNLRVDNGELCFEYAEGYAPKDLDTKIDTDSKISICKKMYSTDEDSFYKNNTILSKYSDVPFEEDRWIGGELWGKDSALYKISYHFEGHGVLVPTISYDFTIPSEMFTKERGCIFFAMASYLTKDFYPYGSDGGRAGLNFDKQMIEIYYQKQGDKIVLSSKYQG